MDTARSSLVEIARDFLLAYRRTREVASLHRAGELQFELVKGWVGDDESSALFRLKECCHAMFRSTERVGSGSDREALFDFTVGALFHEAMRFRENFYQREVYGTRIGRLNVSSPEESELITEFEKIQKGASARLDEALQESETLLDQTLRQFRSLLRSHCDDGLVTRYLIENAGYVALAFGQGLEELLADVHGDIASAHALAGKSYLASGHFDEALDQLNTAIDGGGEREAWLRLRTYALGMHAYLEGRHGEAVESLGRWLDAKPEAEEREYARLALDAISHLDRLLECEDREKVLADAAALTTRLQALLGDA